MTVERGRLAPSPTGRMHLGNARTALLAWLAARHAGGKLVLRIEDLDAARVVPGAETAWLDDLGWLGLDWDEGPTVGGPAAPYRQSERRALHAQALGRLVGDGRAYPCACSRAEVARAASAPHAEDEDGARYPGTCRGRTPAEIAARLHRTGRAATLRFDGRGERIAFLDGLRGPVEPVDPAGVDDFVLRRADGVPAYQLAVVVDDAAMGVTEVVRGDDLLRSTPRQIALHRALGSSPPRWLHVPLVLAPGGERLAKRARPPGLGALRDAGWAPEAVVGLLAASAGLCPTGTEVRPRDLVPGWDPARLTRAPATLDPWLPGRPPGSTPG